jgi:hypothetical protein
MDAFSAYHADILDPGWQPRVIALLRELGHAKWPGETAALRDVLGPGQPRLSILPGRGTPAYLRWGR